MRGHGRAPAQTSRLLPNIQIVHAGFVVWALSTCLGFSTCGAEHGAARQDGTCVCGAHETPKWFGLNCKTQKYNTVVVTSHHRAEVCFARTA